VNDYMQDKPGYVGHRLHRALSDDARYRFVNYVEWASVEHWAAAHDAGFRELVGRPGWEHFTTTPATYESSTAPARSPMTNPLQSAHRPHLSLATRRRSHQA
jgi:hypothetical protein